MYTCGDIGKLQADELLIRVPLRLHEQVGSNGRTPSGNIVGVLKDINQTCLQYQRELVRRTVCKVSLSLLASSAAYGGSYPIHQIAARTMIQWKEYGLALAYCISAEDWPGLGRVVEGVLEEYISSGQFIIAIFEELLIKVLQVRLTSPSMQRL